MAMTYDLVGREDVANAIAMNSTQFQLSRVVGPALAGVAFRVFGLAGCFFANGLSFIAVVVALWMVRMERSPNALASSGKQRGDLARPGRRFALCSKQAARLVVVAPLGREQSIWRALLQHGTDLRTRYLSTLAKQVWRY